MVLNGTVAFVMCQSLFDRVDEGENWGNFYVTIVKFLDFDHLQIKIDT